MPQVISTWMATGLRRTQSRWCAWPRVIYRRLEDGNPVLSLANRLLHLIRHRMNCNTVTDSRLNIQAHYDLSNDFFRLFLDRNMVYSSAVYRHADDSAPRAQRAERAQCV
jgi:Mycolic acid cyclopropane synthetase